MNPGRLATGSSERRLRVLVVDDHEVVHWGLRLMLGEQPWVERCVSARNSDEAVALTQRYEPHVALVDLFVGQESGAEICERLRREHSDLHLVLSRGSERVSVPRSLESLAQSVLAEAVRNAHKHAQPTRVEVGLERKDGALVLDVCNDGVKGRPKQTGMGLRLAALEALQVGGIVEFGEREPGLWRVRLAVPVDRA